METDNELCLLCISHDDDDGGTGGADSQSSQGPAETCSSVLRLEPDQTVLNQLTQRRRETLQVLLHLEMTQASFTLYERNLKSLTDVPCY